MVATHNRLWRKQLGNGGRRDIQWNYNPTVIMSTDSTPENRTGAPAFNLNSARNGRTIRRLSIGELPKTMRRQTAAARKYRRELETLVASIKGEVTATDAHLIDLASGAEIHSAVCKWLLRERLPKMTVQDIVTCSREILKARETRNKAVSKLQIDPNENTLTALYTIPEAKDSDDDQP